jgi:streptogramin lyase
VWLLSRGSDHVVWFDADRPRAGPREFVNPAETAAGLDHVGLGDRYLWWTEGLANNVTRYDPRTKELRGYEVPVPLGYFNPHGIWVATRWREVWFTERESLCRLRFKDGRAP